MGKAAGPSGALDEFSARLPATRERHVALPRVQPAGLLLELPLLCRLLTAAIPSPAPRRGLDRPPVVARVAAVLRARGDRGGGGGAHRQLHWEHGARLAGDMTTAKTSDLRASRTRAYSLG